MKQSTPVDERAEVRLPDDSRVTIRPVEPGDKSLLGAAFTELGEESRYRRFFTPLHERDARQLAHLTEVDHHDHEALVAIDIRSGACVAWRLSCASSTRSQSGARPLAAPRARDGAVGAAGRCGVARSPDASCASTWRFRLVAGPGRPCATCFARPPRVSWLRRAFMHAKPPDDE
jgi:hypothetical protein